MHHIARRLGVVGVVEATCSRSHASSMRAMTLAHVARMVPRGALVVLRRHRAFIVVLWDMGRIARGRRRHHLMRKCGTVINWRYVRAVGRRRGNRHHRVRRTMMVVWKRMGRTMRVVTEVGRPLGMVHWPRGFFIEMHRFRSNFLWPVKLSRILNIVFYTWLKFCLL